MGSSHIDKDQQLKLSQIVSNLSDDAVLITDHDNVIIHANDKFLDLTGYTLEEIVGRKPNLLKSGIHSAEYYDQMWIELEQKGLYEGEIWDRKKSGEIYPKHMKIIAVKDRMKRIKYHVSIQTDLSPIKKLELEKEQHEYYSDETGLPNEKYLNKLMHAMFDVELNCINYSMRVINRAQIEARIGSTGYIDAIISYTTKVKQWMPKEALFGEIDKNTFFISIPTHLVIDISVLQILKKLASSIQIDTTFIALEMKYGSSVYPLDAATPEMILSKTQMAMNYAIEQTEIQYQPYHQDLERLFKAEQEYQSALSTAIEKNQIKVYYQPQMNAITNEVVGVESLLRWHHPEKGIISPAIFIPIAEKYGYIRKLDAFVAKKAIQDYKKLIQINPNLQISINASTFELINDDYFEMIKETLEFSAMPKNKLTIELTEGRTISDVNRLIEYTKKFRNLGVQVSLDDFGTGFNSIASMMDMALDELKIDRSFIKGYPDHSGALTKSVIRMAEAMKLRVVCEGVETEVQKQFLLEHDCHIMQGFLFSKPVPLSELLTYASTLKSTVKKIL